MNNTVTQKLLEFIDASPSPFHAVAEASSRLRAEGASELFDYQDNWNLESGKLYYCIRHATSLLAFKCPDPKSIPRGKGQQKSQGLKTKPDFQIIGAHTDSPCLKLKPRAASQSHGYQQWGVEVYGSPLQNSWLDRDLFLAGKIHLQHGDKSGEALVRLNQFALRIPQLAIHLDRGVNDNGLILNRQKHLTPVLGLQTTSNKPSHSPLEDALAESLINSLKGQPFWKASTIRAALQGGDFSIDLRFYSAEASRLGGLAEEFIYAPRLDNLAMCHAAIEALCNTKSFESHIPLIALFDHEEVGSQSAQGAQSNFLMNTMERISFELGIGRKDFLSVLPSSWILSADMAHAVHPNYSERHEPDHLPFLNQGPVIKYNAGERYATDALGSSLVKKFCKKEKIPFQEFVTRSDLACGTTIGPIISALTGIRAIDVGNPMLSMHSAREMAGSQDHPLMIKLMNSFLSHAASE